MGILPTTEQSNCDGNLLTQLWRELFHPRIHPLQLTRDSNHSQAPWSIAQELQRRSLFQVVINRPRQSVDIFRRRHQTGCKLDAVHMVKSNNTINLPTRQKMTKQFLNQATRTCLHVATVIRALRKMNGSHNTKRPHLCTREQVVLQTRIIDGHCWTHTGSIG